MKMKKIDWDEVKDTIVYLKPFWIFLGFIIAFLVMTFYDKI